MSELTRILFTLEARSQESGARSWLALPEKDNITRWGRLRQTSRRKDESPGGSEPPAECICKGDFWLLASPSREGRSAVVGIPLAVSAVSSFVPV